MFSQMIDIVDQIEKVEDGFITNQSSPPDIEELFIISDICQDFKNSIYTSMWKIFPRETVKLLREQSTDWVNQTAAPLIRIGRDDPMSQKILYTKTRQLPGQFPFLDDYRRLVTRLRKSTFSIEVLVDIFSDILEDLDDFIRTDFKTVVDTFRLQDDNRLSWYTQFLMDIHDHQINYFEDSQENILGEDMTLYFGDFQIDNDKIKDRLLEMKTYDEAHNRVIFDIIDLHLDMFQDDEYEVSIQNFFDSMEPSIERAQSVLDDYKETIDFLKLLEESPEQFISQFVVIFSGIDNVYSITHFVGLLGEVLENPDSAEISSIENFNLSWDEFPDYLEIAETRWQPTLMKYSDSNFKELCRRLSDRVFEFINSRVEELELVNYRVVTLEKTLVDFDHFGIPNKSGLNKKWRRNFGDTMIKELDGRINKYFDKRFPLLRIDIDEEEYLEDNFEVDYKKEYT